MPPLSMILENIRNTILPAFVPALVMMLLGVLIFRRHLAGGIVGPIAAGLAMIAGIGIGNASSDTLPFNPTGPAINGLMLMMGLVILGSMLTQFRSIPMRVGWLIRAGIIGFAAYWLMPNGLRTSQPMMLPILGGCMLAMQAIGESLSRQKPGGIVPVCFALPAGIIAGVLIFAHSNRMMDAAHLLFASLCAVTLIAFWRKLDVGPAIAAAAVMLPALGLNGLDQTYSDVPKLAFVLTALAPMLAGIALIPSCARSCSHRVGVWMLVLVMIPALGGLGLAMANESLPTVEESDW